MVYFPVLHPPMIERAKVEAGEKEMEPLGEQYPDVSTEEAQQ